MIGLESWFQGLHIVFKCLVALGTLPFIFTFVGALIFMMETPPEGFQQGPWWQQVLGTTVFGSIGSVILAAVYGVYWLISLGFARFQAGSWSGTVSFFLALFIVLIGIFVLSALIAERMDR